MKKPAVKKSNRPRKIKPSYGINRLKKFFPKLLTVSDSHQRVEVEVLERDCSGATKGNVAACALARACKRALKVDGALIGLTYSYLIKGTHATRFRTPQTVAREIITFDRHHDFDTGKYHLSRISPSQGYARTRERNEALRKHRKNNPSPYPTPVDDTHRIVHTTARVRKAPV